MDDDSDDNAGEPIDSFSVNEETEGGLSDPGESSESSLFMSDDDLTLSDAGVLGLAVGHGRRRRRV